MLAIGCPCQRCTIGILIRTQNLLRISAFRWNGLYCPAAAYCSKECNPSAVRRNGRGEIDLPAGWGSNGPNLAGFNGKGVQSCWCIQGGLLREEDSLAIYAPRFLDSAIDRGLFVVQHPHFSSGCRNDATP